MKIILVTLIFMVTICNSSYINNLFQSFKKINKNSTNFTLNNTNNKHHFNRIIEFLSLNNPYNVDWYHIYLDN